MTITLTEDEASTLFAAAEEAQGYRYREMRQMEDGADFERHEIMHFKSKMQRTENVLFKLEKKLTFPLER